MSALKTGVPSYQVQQYARKAALAVAQIQAPLSKLRSFKRSVFVFVGQYSDIHYICISYIFMCVHAVYHYIYYDASPEPMMI